MGEGEKEREQGRDRERQDRPVLLKTLFTPGTKQHVISAPGETLTRAGKERRKAVESEGKDRAKQEVKQNYNHSRTVIQ